MGLQNLKASLVELSSKRVYSKPNPNYIRLTCNHEVGTLNSRRQEVFDQIEVIFKGGNLVHQARMFEYLLSRLDPAPTPLQWINPFTLAALSSQEPDAPDYYTISVKYPDGCVLQESHYPEDGPKAQEIVLTVDEAKEMMHRCLATIMKEISETKIL
jgi:hypothetical protein